MGGRRQETGWGIERIRDKWDGRKRKKERGLKEGEERREEVERGRRKGG